jgi:hypothetical protein
MKKEDFLTVDWEKMKTDTLAVLSQVARSRGLITYSEFARRIGGALDVQNRDEAVVLGQLLTEVSLQQHKRGRGILSAVVIQKTGDQEPGPGFFTLAQALGKKYSDRTVFWVEECKKVHHYWAVKSLETPAGKGKKCPRKRKNR